MATAGVTAGTSGAPGAGASGGAGPLLPLARPGIGLASLPNTSPAPEVATWSMLVVGAGIVGGTMRWRRREQAA